MESARLHGEVVDEYLQTEISLGRVAGTFPPDAIPDGHVSRFGVISKNHQPNKWWLIVDLSYPTAIALMMGSLLLSAPCTMLP